MDSKEDPEDTTRHNGTDTEDSEFEDALEELVTASGMGEPSEVKTSQKDAESHSQQQGQSDDNLHCMERQFAEEIAESHSQQQGQSDDNLHCMERQFAEEIVKDVIESAKQKMTSSNSDVASDSDVTNTETLYQDIPADGSDGDEINGGEQEEATSKQQEELKESEMKEDKVGKGDDDGVKEDEEKDDGEESEEDERFVVDEEVLKEREANLTDEEKQVSSKRSYNCIVTARKIQYRKRC